MHVELIVCILLGIMMVISMWMAGEYWQEKEHYKCRVFELIKEKEGGKRVKVAPGPLVTMAQPTRPLFAEWLHNNCGEYFRCKDVVALTQNPNRTMNVVLCNGHTINTGLELDDLKKVLGISFLCSVDEELTHWKKMYNKEG